MSTKEKKMSFKAAEDLFEELLRTGGADALRDVRRRACTQRMTPVQVLVEHGDPREENQ